MLKRKQGKEDLVVPLRGIENILSNTYYVIPYQENVMMISKQVSGFDDNQADSLTRKILAKKKVEQMPMLERCHIYGKKKLRRSKRLGTR